MELTCVRSPSKKDGKLRLSWRTGLQVSIKKQGDSLIVGNVDSLRATHRTMMRLAPALSTFTTWLDSEPIVEGIIASILIAPDELVNDDGSGLSRILQALKDSYRALHPEKQVRNT